MFFRKEVTKMSWIKHQFNKLFKMDEIEEYEDDRTYYYEEEEETIDRQKGQYGGLKAVQSNESSRSQSFRFPLIEDEVYEEAEPQVQYVQRNQSVSRKEYYNDDDAPLKLPNHLQKQETNVSYDGEVSGIRELLERRRKGRGYSNVIRSSDDISRKVVVTKEEREVLTSKPMREERKINKEFINPLENRKRFVPTEVPSPVHGFLKPTPIEQLMEKHDATEEVAASTAENNVAEFDELALQNDVVMKEVALNSGKLAHENEGILTQSEPTPIEQVENIHSVIAIENQLEESTSIEPITFEAEVTEVDEKVITDPMRYENIDAPPILTEELQQSENDSLEIKEQSANEVLNEVQVQHVTIENSTIHIGQLNVEQNPQVESDQEGEEPPVSTQFPRENRGSRVPFNVVMLKSDKEKLQTKKFVYEQMQQSQINERVETVEAQLENDETRSIQLPEANAQNDEEQQTDPIVMENTDLNEHRHKEQEIELIEELDTAIKNKEVHTRVEQPIVTQHAEKDLATYNNVLHEQQPTETELEVEVEAENKLQTIQTEQVNETIDEEKKAEEGQFEEIETERLIEPEYEATDEILKINDNDYADAPVDAEQKDDQNTQVLESEEVQEVIEVQPVKKRIPYVKPPLEYLVPPEEMVEDRDWMDEQGDNLVETLSYFQIQAHIESIVQGPAVTQFEITVGQGTKVSKVRNLADDIKLALAAKDIRIDAPIPGKRSIGIEIPNRISRSVRLSEVTDSESFLNSDSPLEAALGLDLTGKPVTIDLRKMPHGLIAGATGSGKSVCINSILVSLLYKADPNELKLMLIDPKMVELAPFNHIPHLVSPVITDVKAATAALKWAVEEMERRYQLFMHSGARKIEAYNKMCDENGMYAQKLPYLLIVIDELADLMMMSPQDVEDSICRITQKARAAGIHLIVATQRPSVDVITGLIKSNIPTRIAFSVSSQIDSRTILDTQGAERLLGRGDMLYLGNGMSAPTRIQGTFVTDDEIEEIIEFVREQGEPEYIFKQEELLKRTEAAEDQDELFEEVCRFVYEQGSASTSLLQRRYHIGYNRAARLIDMLERQGYVSEPKGSKPRDVFITEEDLAVQFGD